MRFIFCFSWWLILPAFGLFSQNDSIYSLTEIEVKASRLGLTKGDISQQVYILTAEDIKSMPAASFNDLLQFLPGIESQQRGAYGVQSDLLIRGSTFNQVLILLDGVRINDPLTGHFNGYLPLALHEIHHIEVLRGSVSALYGTEAVGGVINIVTYNFVKEYGDTENNYSGEIFLGKYHQIQTKLGGRWATETFSFSSGFALNTSDGHIAQEDTSAYDFTLLTASVSGSYTPNQALRASFRTSYDFRDFNARYFYTRSSFDQSREEIKRVMVQSQVQYDFTDKQSTTLSLGYLSTQDSFLFNPRFTGNHHTTRSLDLNLTHTFQLGQFNRISGGYHLLRKNIVSNDRGDHDRTQHGLFTAGHFEFGPVSIQPGLRLQFDPVFEQEWVPQLGFKYKIQPGNELRGFVGRAIRSPDFTEAYISTQLPGILSDGRNLGNPDLVAEKSWNSEIGWDGYGNHWSFSGTLFVRWATDLIDYTLTPGIQISTATNISGTHQYFYATNLEKLTTSGIDLELGYRQTWANGLEMQILAGYLGTHISQDEEKVSKYIANQAGHLFSLNLNVSANSWSFSLQTQYKDRTADDAIQINKELKKSYFLTNTSVRYTPFSIPLSLHLKWDNVFNQTYADILGATLPGSWWRFGIRYN